MRPRTDLRPGGAPASYHPATGILRGLALSPLLRSGRGFFLSPTDSQTTDPQTVIASASEAIAGSARKNWIASSQVLLSHVSIEVQTPPRSRDVICPSFANSFAQIRRRGRRECRVRAAPAVSCANMHIKKRTRAYRFSGGSPAFPAQWFYGLFRALPGETRLVCHRHPRDAKKLASQELDTSHWGVRTTRLRRPRQCALVCRNFRVHRSPRPTSVTIATRPSWWVRDGVRCEGDLPSRSSSTAATHWHDGQISKIASSFICRMQRVLRHPEERPLGRVSKDDVQLGVCGHPSRLAPDSASALPGELAPQDDVRDSCRLF